MIISMSTARRLAGWRPDRDEELQYLKQVAEAMWTQVTGRTWDHGVDLVETYYRQDPPYYTLFLERTPIELISTVEVQLHRSDDDWDEVDEGVYWFRWNPSGLRKVDDTAWPYGARVTYNGGYEVDTVPADVARAIVLQAMFIGDRMSKEKLIARNQAAEGRSASYERADLHPFFAAVSRYYRRNV